ncbi:MAG: IclR family transcriptional regulator [Pseudolabrys sp.]
MEKTVVKAIELVECLSRAEQPVGITWLANELSLTKSNVFRLLDTLVQSGYVRRHADTSQYELTLKIWELGLSVLSRLDIKKAAARHIHELMKNTNESVHLSIFADGHVLYIDKVESDQPVRAYSRVGDRPPPHCVATGKVLLAYQSEETVEKVCRSLQRFTPRTITDPRALRKELESVRKLGYGINTGEWRESVCGVAAPIRDWSGSVVGAVGISGPAERLKPNKLPRLAPIVMGCADQISAELSYPPLTAPQRTVKPKVRAAR